MSDVLGNTADGVLIYDDSSGNAIQSPGAGTWSRCEDGNSGVDVLLSSMTVVLGNTISASVSGRSNLLRLANGTGVAIDGGSTRATSSVALPRAWGIPFRRCLWHHPHRHRRLERRREQLQPTASDGGRPAARPNLVGVEVISGASNNTVGGTTAGAYRTRLLTEKRRRRGSTVMGRAGPWLRAISSGPMRTMTRASGWRLMVSKSMSWSGQHRGRHDRGRARLRLSTRERHRDRRGRWLGHYERQSDRRELYRDRRRGREWARQQRCGHY